MEEYDKDTNRAAYTVAFPEVVYVLHVFKKKSTSGVRSPRPDRDLVRTRFRAAEADYRGTYRTEGER